MVLQTSEWVWSVRLTMIVAMIAKTASLNACSRSPPNTTFPDIIDVPS